MTLKQKIIRLHIKLLDIEFYSGIFAMWAFAIIPLCIFLYISLCVLYPFWLLALPLVVILLISGLITFSHYDFDTFIRNKYKPINLDMYEDILYYREYIKGMKKQIRLIRKFKHIDFL